ncbi:hypothetical protein B0T24DRAFT_564079 [Lasiosphaeria ovina]|uniref:F-box domain-containing protein n=1 Tax=Lasiosphaeria ovina TaxID=92902 RepID=A0AAE0NIK3_9PEZI|nr:hypothetical protein B0T24DRAFT_564079 [Lasiosphaeria ovina]
MLHNSRHCPLCRLPTELMLMVLEYLRAPKYMATRFCLSHTCRLLRRFLLKLRGFFVLSGTSSRVAGSNNAMSLYLKAYHPWVRAAWSQTRYCNTLKFLLRKDQLCPDCLGRSDLAVSEAASGLIVSHGQRPLPGCKFASHTSWNGRLYCAGCDGDHDPREFSAAQKARGDERVCIGRDGKLRLCEHRSISWVLDVEPTLKKVWGSDELDIEIAVCDHPDHRMCPYGTKDSKNEPIMPRIKLKGSFYGPDNLRLRMTWSAHAAIDVDENGHFDSRDVRAIGEKIRWTSHPNHYWLHAVDPDSYELDNDIDTLGNVWPVCKNETCQNYYKRYQTSDCSNYRELPIFSASAWGKESAPVDAWEHLSGQDSQIGGEQGRVDSQSRGHRMNGTHSLVVMHI